MAAAFVYDDCMLTDALRQGDEPHPITTPVLHGMNGFVCDFGLKGDLVGDLVGVLAFLARTTSAISLFLFTRVRLGVAAGVWSAAGIWAAEVDGPAWARATI